MIEKLVEIDGYGETAGPAVDTPFPPAGDTGDLEHQRILTPVGVDPERLTESP